MLTISKPLSSSQAQTYHAKEFTAKEQNYWSQKGEIRGEWQGQLAARLGLTRAVSSADFARLSQGQHPETGEQLVRQRASYEYQSADGKTVKTMEHRAGWDATFSASKSVSLTALVGGDDRVRNAHRESVRVALEQLEQYTQARIGGNHAPETTAKFIAAKFEHDTEVVKLVGFTSTNLKLQPNKWTLNREIFAIRHGRKDYLPLYGLNPDDHRPRKEMAEILNVFGDAKDGWGLAFWFAGLNSFLDDERPQDVLATDPDRVIAAARDEMELQRD